MNKFKLLVAPLLVLPFVIGCNNGGGQDVVVYHTLKFVSETCYMKDDIGGQISEKQFEAGETANFHLDPHEGYLLPLENQVDFKDTKTDEDFTGTYSYNPTNGDISVKMTADVTIYAGNSEDPNYVNAQEFDDAISFKDIQYLQVMESNHSEAYMSEYYYKKEMSPTVYYDLGSENPINASNAEAYCEEYCRKNDNPITYDRCYRIDSTDPFDFYTGVESSHFKTPQTFQIGLGDVTLADLIKIELGLTYDSFEYIKEECLYKAEFSDYEGYSGWITLKFDEKRVTNYEIKIDAEGNTVGSFTYLKKTPEYPSNPIVSEDEFNTACGLVGVQLLQVAQRTVTNSGEGDYIQDTNIEISDLVYYMSQDIDVEGEMYDYFLEMYSKINQLGDTTCIYTVRDNNEQTDWSTPEEADAQQYCIRPENCNPLLIKDMTLYECNPSSTYENFELSDNKYVYTGEATYFSSDPYDARMELTFNHKKLTHCLFTVNNDDQYRFECTYKYENITPVWPL